MNRRPSGHLDSQGQGYTVNPLTWPPFSHRIPHQDSDTAATQEPPPRVSFPRYFDDTLVPVISRSHPSIVLIRGVHWSIVLDSMVGSDVHGWTPSAWMHPPSATCSGLVQVPVHPFPSIRRTDLDWGDHVTRDLQRPRLFSQRLYLGGGNSRTKRNVRGRRRSSTWFESSREGKRI